MPRGKKPSVRYWDSRGAYCCWIDGVQHVLARGPDDAPTGPTYLAAFTRFKKLVEQGAGKGTDHYLVSALLNQYCVGHCQCLSQPLDSVLKRLAALDPARGLDDPSGPFAGLGEAERNAGGRIDGENASHGKSELFRLSLLGRAEDLLTRLDHITPADGDEMCSLFLERGWVEAVRHFARAGMLTPQGLSEAGSLIAASNEWADGLSTDGAGGLAG